MFFDGRPPTPIDVQLAIGFICVGVPGFLAISAILIRDHFKKINKIKPEQTQAKPIGNFFENGFIEKILTRRTQKSGPVAALDVMEEAIKGKNISFEDGAKMIGIIADAALPALDKKIEEKYPPQPPQSPGSTS